MPLLPRFKSSPLNLRGPNFTFSDELQHNLPEVINKAIEELMQSMHLKLSPQAQQQYDEAINAETTLPSSNNVHAQTC